MSGLDNFGNTCFVNSVVQMLRYAKPVVKKLVEQVPEKEGSKDEALMCFLDLLYQGSKPRKFVRYLKDLGFDPIYQHDAHEFMMSMLDKLYESVSESNPFEGCYNSVLTCKNGHKSVSKEKFICISINGDLEEGIVQLQEPEVVECKCDHCEETSMTKQVEIHPGKLVCVHLKRFTMDEKLDYKVTILKKWNGYNLIGMCNHYGSLHGGHYTSTVKTGEGWMHMNDEFVKKIDGLPRISKLPYIMVYELEE